MANEQNIVDLRLRPQGYNGDKPYFVRVKMTGRSGTEVTGSFSRLADARAFRNEKLSDRSRGEWVDPKAGEISFEEFAEQWRKDQRQHAGGTVDQIETHFRNHVYPLIGKRPLSKFKPEHIQRLISEMDSDGHSRGRGNALGAGTIEVIYSYVSSVFANAVQNDRIRKTPCIQIRLPKADAGNSKLIPLKESEVLIIHQKMEGIWQAAVLTAAGSGLRPGELFGLTEDRIDFKNGLIKVDRQLLTPTKGEVYLGPLKTPASYRTVPIPEELVAALKTHIEIYEPTVHLIRSGKLPKRDEATGEWLPDRRKPIKAKLVFGLNEPPRRQRQVRGWQRAIDGMDVPDRSGWHALRHFYASSLVHGGESVKVVQARLGHKSANETLDTYSHLWPDDENSTRAIVGRTMARLLKEAEPPIVASPQDAEEAVIETEDEAS